MKSSSLARIANSAEQSGLVLLYHSVSIGSPGRPPDSVHNVSPDVFERHLVEIGEFFEFVTLDAFIAMEDKSGYACLTFDDGYKNSLTHCLPILERLKIPAIWFLTPIVFAGGFNWRDKVRHLLNSEQGDNFLEQFPLQWNTGRFYRASKSPENHSATLDRQLDLFLDGQNPAVYNHYPYLQTTDLVNPHPLVEFGNHSFQHYVMSSLSKEEQQFEISQARQRLETLSGDINVNSRCFSAPFGGTRDINEVTLELLPAQGYDSIVMSRQQLQPAGKVLDATSGVQIIERFMPRTADILNEIADILT